MTVLATCAPNRSLKPNKRMQFTKLELRQRGSAGKFEFVRFWGRLAR